MTAAARDTGRHRFGPQIRWDRALAVVVLLGLCAACTSSSPTAPSPSASSSAGVVSAVVDGVSYSAGSVARASVSGPTVSVTSANGSRGLGFTISATAPGTYAVQSAALVEDGQTWGVGLSFVADGSRGTVVLNAISATRVSGTFQLTVVQPSTGSTRAVTSGRFDVPVQ